MSVLTVLSESDIESIRREFSAGASKRTLAAKYHIHRQRLAVIVADIPAPVKEPKPKPAAKPRTPKAVRKPKERRQRTYGVVKCSGCPLLFLVRSGKTQKFCSLKCRQLAAQRDQKLWLEEVRWIAGTDTWDNIASRVGCASRDALERRLVRLGENKLVSEIHCSDILNPWRQKAAYERTGRSAGV